MFPATDILIQLTFHRQIHYGVTNAVQVTYLTTNSRKNVNLFLGPRI